MPYCTYCGKELIVTEGPAKNEAPYFDFNTGKKMQKMYKWYKCPDYSTKFFTKKAFCILVISRK